MKTYYSLILVLVAIVFLSSCTETQAAFTNAVYECKETFDVQSPGYFSDWACELCEVDPLKKPATGGPNSANGRCGFGAFENEKGLCYKSGLCNSQNIIGTSSEFGICETGYDCCIYYQQSVGYEIGDLCGYLNLGKGAKMAACVPENTCGSSGGTVIFENQNDFRKCKIGAECCQVENIVSPPVQEVPPAPQGFGTCTDGVCMVNPLGEGITDCGEGNGKTLCCSYGFSQYKYMYRNSLPDTSGCINGASCWIAGGTPEQTCGSAPVATNPTVMCNHPVTQQANTHSIGACTGTGQCCQINDVLGWYGVGACGGCCCTDNNACTC